MRGAMLLRSMHTVWTLVCTPTEEVVSVISVIGALVAFVVACGVDAVVSVGLTLLVTDGGGPDDTPTVMAMAWLVSVILFGVTVAAVVVGGGLV